MFPKANTYSTPPPSASFIAFTGAPLHDLSSLQLDFCGAKALAMQRHSKKHVVRLRGRHQLSDPCTIDDKKRTQQCKP